MKNIEFFFDLMSPYAYLAHCRLPALAEKYGYGITYKPIDLKAAKLAAGNTGPSTAQMPAKLRYAIADLTRWAQKYDVPFSLAMSGPPMPERANKGAFYALGKGQERDYVARLWAATFGAGGDVNSDALLSDVARQMGWSPEVFLEFIRSDKAARLYDELNKEAHARGVFGVPTMIVDDQMWWGNDRLALLEEYLAERRAA